MADKFLNGEKFALLLTVDNEEVEVVCKSDSTINFTNTSVEVRNRCTGEYSVRTTGGQKSGSIDFTGDLDNIPNGNNLTGFDLAELLGDVLTAVWGGDQVGDKIVTVPVQINNVSISTPFGNQATFSATLDFAGKPIFGTVQV